MLRSSNALKTWGLDWAEKLGHTLVVVEARIESDFNAAFAELASKGATALVIHTEPFFGSKVKELATLTVQHALPAIQGNLNFAPAGGFISYGASFTDAFRKAGNYAGQILKGAKPADLPVEQATKYHLVINLKTARALGLTVPASLLARADEVIE